jgi:hypothetical protein
MSKLEIYTSAIKHELNQFDKPEVNKKLLVKNIAYYVNLIEKRIINGDTTTCQN